LKQSLTLALLGQDTSSLSSLSSSSQANKSPIGTRGMLWLRSGGIQLLPSRDRSGRRVVILELGSTTQDACQYQPHQTQLQQVHAMVSTVEKRILKVRY